MYTSPKKKRVSKFSRFKRRVSSKLKRLKYRVFGDPVSRNVTIVSYTGIEPADIKRYPYKAKLNNLYSSSSQQYKRYLINAADHKAAHLGYAATGLFSRKLSNIGSEIEHRVYVMGAGVDADEVVRDYIDKKARHGHQWSARVATKAGRKTFDILEKPLTKGVAKIERKIHRAVRDVQDVATRGSLRKIGEAASRRRYL